MCIRGPSKDAPLELTRAQRGQAAFDLERGRLVRELLAGEILRARRVILGGTLDRSPGRGADRRHEVLFAAVAELEPPRDGALGLLAQSAHAVAERGEVCLLYTSDAAD